MSTRIEGYNSFSNYDTLHFILESSRTRTIDKVQLNFGSMVETYEDYTHIRNHLYNIRQYFHNKSKEGYYKPKFIFIDGATERLKQKKRGLLFNQAFFFLQETYEKEFVYNYFVSLFQEINDIHKNHPNIKFIKYKSRKKDRIDG